MKALIAGGTGLVGSHLTELLDKHPQVDSVVGIQRNAQFNDLKKVKEKIIDFEALPNQDLDESFDTAFCCLGTTMKKAGSKEAFGKVDRDFVLNFAALAKKSGVSNFLVVSAMGANKKSMFFYNRIKGEVEERLQEQNFYGLSIFRPSLLVGERKEARFGEKFGEFALAVLNPVLKGPLTKYAAIKAETVAKAMLINALDRPQGLRIFDSGEIHNLVKIRSL